MSAPLRELTDPFAIRARIVELYEKADRIQRFNDALRLGGVFDLGLLDGKQQAIYMARVPVEWQGSALFPKSVFQRLRWTLDVLEAKMGARKPTLSRRAARLFGVAG